MTTRAIITGVTGQDGSYLADLLLAKGYEVHGLLRRSSSTLRLRLDLDGEPANARKGLHLHYGELSDAAALRRVVERIQPHEFYHLAGQSHVGLSFEIPESTCDFTAMGTLRVLEILRDVSPNTRFLNIGSSEVFGSVEEHPQSTRTRRNPTSPYGVAKGFAVDMVKVYRSLGMFAVNAICYNHESPRRGESFVTKKIAKAVASIKRNGTGTCELGNLDVQRDWGFAPEYVDAMWLLLQQESAQDVVLATGQLTTLREYLEASFTSVDLDWREFVVTNPKFVRPIEPGLLVGDPTEAREALGWEAKTKATELAALMVAHELSAAGPRSERPEGR